MTVPRYCGSNVLVVPETDGRYAVWRDHSFPGWRVLRLTSHAGAAPYWMWVATCRDRTAATTTATARFRGEER
jgi:hypothetical protein